MKFHWGSVLMVAMPLSIIAIIWWTFAPGYTNGDTIDMLAQSRSLKLNDWHSPLVSIFWSVFPTPESALSTTFFLTLLCFALSAVGIARNCGLSPLSSGLITSLVIITPPVLGGLVCACKDTWVATLFCGAVYFSMLARTGPYYWCVARNLFLVVAALARPEFIVIAVIFVALDTFIFRSKWLAVTCGNIILVVLAYLALHAAILSWKNVDRRHPEQFILLSDLVDLSAHRHEMLVPAPFDNGLTLQWLETTYHDPDTTRCFWPGPDAPPDVHFTVSYDPTDLAVLHKSWLSQAASNFPELVLHRIKLFVHYLWEGAYFQHGIDDNPLGIKLHHPAAAALGTSYLALFNHELFHRHWFSILLAPLLIYALWRRQSPVAQALAWALVCGTLYQLEFSALGLPPYYRFASAGLDLFWIVLYVVGWQFIESKISRR